MKNSFCLLAWAISFSVASAQSSSSSKDFVVKTSGDTVRGTIHDRLDWNASEFIEIDNSRIPTSEVDNFYLENYNTHYLRRKLDVDKKTIDVGHLESSSARRIETETIIIRQIVRGTLNLYEFIDDKTHFFVQKGNGNIEELPYVKYITEGSKIVEMPYFVGMLKPMVSDCDKVSTITTSYTAKALTKVVTSYNSCFDTDTHEIQKVKGFLRVGIFAGVGQSSVDYGGDDLVSRPDPILDARSLDFSKVSSVNGGVDIEFVSGRGGARFIPGVQIGYLKTSRTSAVRSLSTVRKEAWAEFTMASAAAHIKYIVFNRSRWKTFVDISMGVQTLINATSQFTSIDYTQNTQTAPRDFAQYEKLGYTYSAGAGVSFERLFLELKFQQNLCPATTTAAQTNVSTISANLGFQITNR